MRNIAIIIRIALGNVNYVEVGAMSNAENLTLSVVEAARLLGISRNLCYEAIRTGEIPSLRIGKRVLVPRRALEELLNKAARDSPSSVEHGG